MSQKNKGRANNVAPAGQAGGFVPASTEHKPKRGGVRRAQSIEFGPPAPAMADSASQYSRDSAAYSHRNRGMARGKKVALVVVVIAVVAALSGLGFYVFKEMQKSNINEGLHDSYTEEEMQAVDNELTGMTKFDQPFTMLLLGSDARTDDPDLGARTDTIILARVDPVHNKVAMVSIPRDTMIEIEGVGTAKFNAAYTYGGPSGTIAAVKKLCGVDIDHFAEINFEGLVGLIDAIGGIDVMVDETVDDPDAGNVVIPAGMQHLNGEAALTFSRSRAYADGDYTRVSNQRKVIEAIIHKGLEAPATELYGIVRASTGFLTTDSGMDVDFIYSLADQMRHNNDDPFTLYSATIPSATGMVGDISYVIADNAGVAELMKIFMECGDVSQGVAASSVGEDVDKARNAHPGNTSEHEGNQNVANEEPVYYYEEQVTYVEPTPAPDAGTANTDGGAAVDNGAGAGAGDAAGTGAAGAGTADAGAAAGAAGAAGATGGA